MAQVRFAMSLCTVFLRSSALFQHLHGNLPSSVKVFYVVKDVFMWLTTRLGTAYVIKYFRSFQLGPKRCVLVISSMVPLIVDHVQKLRNLMAKASMV